MNDEHVSAQDDVQRILAERAAELAKSPDDDADGGDARTLVAVTLGHETYGIDIECIKEIRPLGEITTVPATPPFWLGLINLRGTLVPVLDLGRYLGQSADLGAVTDDPQAVVVADDRRTIALRVDTVLEVRSVKTADIGPSLVEATSDRPHVHAGLTRDLLAVLDMDALLEDPALQVHDEVD